jgi:hypothetical protein
MGANHADNNLVRDPGRQIRAEVMGIYLTRRSRVACLQKIKKVTFSLSWATLSTTLKQCRKLLVAAMALVHSIPAVALQRACVPCVADPIRTMAHFDTLQWFLERCVASSNAG